MMKSKRIVALCAFSIACLAFAACGKISEKEVEAFEGVEDFHLALNAETPDYLEGVTIKFDDGSVGVPTVDASKVKLGEVGKYEIKYLYESFERTAEVYVYGTPVFKAGEAVVTDAYTLEYTVAQAEADKSLFGMVKAYDSFGAPLQISAGEDSENFTGDAGEFSVKLSAVDRVGNRASVSYGAKVYGSPVFKAGPTAVQNGATLTCGYKEAKENASFSGLVKAFDTFGEELEVTLKGGSEAFDGSYGQFDVTYQTKDLLNNEAEIVVKVKVTEDELTPTAENISFDLADENAVCNVELKGAEDFELYVGEERVLSSKYELTSDGVELDGNWLKDLADGTVVRLETEHGYCEFTVSIKEEKPFNFTLSGMNNYMFRMAEDAVINKLPAVKGHQDFALSYKVCRENGSDVNSYRIDVSEQGIAVTQADGSKLTRGRYALTVSAAKGERKEEKTVVFSVLDDKEYYKVFASGDNEQAGDKFLYHRGACSLLFEELDATTYGVSGAYKYKVAAGFNTWDKRLQFLPELYTGGLQLKNYNKLTFDLFVTEGNPSFPFCIVNEQYLPFGINEKATGSAVDKAAVEANVWYTVTVDLSGVNKADKELVLCLADETDAACAMLLRNFVFDDNLCSYASGGTITDASRFSKTDANVDLGVVNLDNNVYGSPAALRYLSKAGDTDGAKLEFNTSLIGQGKYNLGNYLTYSFEMYIVKNIPQQMSFGFDKGGFNMPSMFADGGVKDADGRAVGAVSELTAEKWYKITLDISGVTDSAFLSMYFVANGSENVELYLRNFSFKGIDLRGDSAEDVKYFQYDGGSAMTYDAEANALRFTNTGEASTWDSRLQFLSDLYKTSFNMNKFSTVTFDIFVESGRPSFPFYLFADQYRQMAFTDSATGEAVEKTNVTNGKWYTVSLEVGFVSEDGKELFICFNDKDKNDPALSVLLKNFTFIKK